MDEFFILSRIYRAYQDTVSFILVENKYVFISLVGCDWELAREDSCYPLLGICDIV